MAPLTNQWDNVRAWWQTATAATRAAATAAVLLLVVGLIAAAMLSASPDYVPIYHNVSGKDAAAIESVLRDHSIPIKYDDKDQSVSVPSKDESSATMYVEAAGVLSQDAEVYGIEKLDTIGMGADSKVIDEKINATNEGELERKLDRLDPVQSASVTIAPGSDGSVFSSDVPPSASVTVHLRPSQNLDDDQVKGIVYLVARSVNNLSTKNITLTDQTGAQLWHDNGTGVNTASEDPLAAGAKFAETKKAELQGLLDQTLGPGKSRVMVSAELNYDQSQTEETEHLPTVPGGSSSLPLSSDEKSETYSGAGAPPAVGGVAGTGSNLGAPSYTSGGASGTTGAYKSNDTRTNYVDNTRHVVTQTAPGGIQKLSVTAVVDSSVPAAEIASVQQFLSSAIHVVPGDTSRVVSVQQWPFDTSAEKQAQVQVKTLQSQELMGNVARAAAVIVVAVVLLLMLTRSGRRAAAPPHALAGEGANIGLLDRNAYTGEIDEAMLEERPLRIEDVLSEMPDIMPGSRPRRRPHAPAIEEQPDLKLESVQEMISASPQSVALLMKGWMYDDARVS